MFVWGQNACDQFLSFCKFSQELDNVDKWLQKQATALVSVPLYHLKPISISTVIHPGAFGMAPFLSTPEMKYRSFHCQQRVNKSFIDFWLDWLSDTGLFELTFSGEKPETTTPLFTASSGSFGCHFLFAPAALVLLPSAALGWRYRWWQVYHTQQVPYIQCQPDDDYLLCFGTTTKDKFLS